MIFSWSGSSCLQSQNITVVPSVVVSSIVVT